MRSTREPPPWDIETPAGFPRCGGRGLLRGRVVGCGAGEHAVMAASLGLEAIGIDTAATAIAVAKAARFLVSEALRLASPASPPIPSSTANCFTFSETRIALRSRKTLASGVRPSGRYLMLCLSECQPGDMAPRLVTHSKLWTSFDHGWRVDSIEPATIEIKSAPPFLPGCRA